MIDLHTHSTHSDGTLTPHELVSLAKKEGLATIALTDHDTINGIEDARNAAYESGITFIAGVELEIEFSKGEFHLLGLGLSKNLDAFGKALEEVRAFRTERNVSMIRTMRSAGIDITLEEVEQIAEGDVIARPHFAKVLIKKKVIKTVDEAFDKYLEKGRPFYYPKKVLSLSDAIALIKASGGLPVIAHPFSLLLSWQELKETLLEFKKKGLLGVEAYHPQHDSRTCSKLVEFAKENGFFVSGGSDFHGHNTPGIKLGYAPIGKKIPDELNLPFVSRK
jgi:predicted metal-dependent phosphoesterase TrpH